MNGTLARGAAGGADEMGHTTVDERGPPCLGVDAAFMLLEQHGWDIHAS